MVEPTPTKLAIIDPLLRHHKTESINIITNRLLYIRHSKKGDSLFNIGCRIDFAIHGRLLLLYHTQRLANFPQVIGCVDNGADGAADVVGIRPLGRVVDERLDAVIALTQR